MDESFTLNQLLLEYYEPNFRHYAEDNTLYEDGPASDNNNKMSYYYNQQSQQQAPAAAPPQQQQGVPTTHQQQHHHHQLPAPTGSVQQQQQLKRKMTLDLNTAKRPRLFQQEVLSSPDVSKLISTPELDRLIMSTTDPNVLQTPTSVFFPKNVTEQQEQYVKGFENALKQLHEGNTSSSFNDHDDTSSTSSSYTTGKHHNSLTDFANVVIKEEPNCLPEDSTTTGDDDEDDDSNDDSIDDDASLIGGKVGSNISPIDMASQEKIKLERKRQRNRLAASKCRRKKLERIAKLEDKVKQLKGENNELGNVLVKLRESVQQLKSQVMEHVQAGCPIVVNLGSNGGFS